MDSLMSVELKSLLEVSTGRSLPSTLTFNYPTIHELAGYLEATVLPPVADTGGSLPETSRAAFSPSDDVSPAGTETAIDGLSEDELAGLLSQRLNRLK
jgi:hypothetical protein